MKRLEGKIAVVTGGNSGIGLATAKQFHDEGARVAISGRNQKTLDEAVKLIGPDTLAVQGDVANLGEIDRFFSAVEKELGKIDVLFINAGVAKFTPLDQVSEKHYDEMFDINTKGAYFTLQKALALSERWSFGDPEYQRCQPRRRGERDGICRDQGGIALDHPVGGGGAGQPQHSRECRGAGTD